jgi:translation initiation factor 4E
MEQNPYPLQRKWVIWEMWNQLKPLRESPSNSMQEIGDFQGLHEFWQHWNYLPHAHPMTLFENPNTKVKTIIESINQSIEAIAVFEEKVKPIWEDPVNKNGSHFSFELDILKISKIKDVWDKIVFSVIGETFPYSEDITGCRIADKKEFYLFEIWRRADTNSSRFNSKTLQIKDAISELIGVSEINLINHSSN